MGVRRVKLECSGFCREGFSGNAGSWFASLSFTSAGSDVILLVRIFNWSASLLTTFVRNHQNYV